MDKKDIQRSPGDFLYVFLSDDNILTISRTMGADKAKIINRKRLNQLKLLKAAYDGNIDKGKADVRNWIVATYGYNPEQVFLKLVAGEAVAGKNWKKGIYGVGNLPSDTFADGSSYKVDSNTGKLTLDGSEVDGGTPLYLNNSKGESYIDGWAYVIGNKSYTTELNADGNYYASCYGTENGGYFANGDAFNVSQSSNFWSGLSTYFPLVKSLLDVLIKALTKLFGSDKGDDGNTIEPKNTVPTQDEFMVGDNKSSILPILAVALMGGYLLLSGKKK